MGQTLPIDAVASRFEESRRARVKEFDAWLVAQAQLGQPGKKLHLEVIIEASGLVKVEDATPPRIPIADSTRQITR